MGMVVGVRTHESCGNTWGLCRVCGGERGDMGGWGCMVVVFFYGSPSPSSSVGASDIKCMAQCMFKTCSTHVSSIYPAFIKELSYMYQTFVSRGVCPRFLQIRGQRPWYLPSAARDSMATQHCRVYIKNTCHMYIIVYSNLHKAYEHLDAGA